MAGERRIDRDHRLRNDPRVRLKGAAVHLRTQLFRTGEKGLQDGTVGVDVALQRPELHVRGVCLGESALQLLEGGVEALLAPPGDAEFAFNAARHLADFNRDFRLDVGERGASRDDFRMPIAQFLGQFRNGTLGDRLLVRQLQNDRRLQTSAAACAPPGERARRWICASLDSSSPRDVRATIN